MTLAFVNVSSHNHFCSPVHMCYNVCTIVSIVRVSVSVSVSVSVVIPSLNLSEGLMN